MKVRSVAPKLDASTRSRSVPLARTGRASTFVNASPDPSGLHTDRKMRDGCRMNLDASIRGPPASRERPLTLWTCKLDRAVVLHTTGCRFESYSLHPRAPARSPAEGELDGQQRVRKTRTLPHGGPTRTTFVASLIGASLTRAAGQSGTHHEARSPTSSSSQDPCLTYRRSEVQVLPWGLYASGAR